ncbi:MAG: type II secretion system secretin GspD [Candidatus Binatia bacterium]
MHGCSRSKDRRFRGTAFASVGGLVFSLCGLALSFPTASLADNPVRRAPNWDLELAQVDGQKLGEFLLRDRERQQRVMREAVDAGRQAQREMEAANAAPVEADPGPAPVVVSTAEFDELDDESQESVVLNFEGADIREVIFTLASSLRLNYWIDPRVQGQVTVRTTGRISRDDLFPVFHQILRNNGFVAIREGDVYSIVPSEEGKTRVDFRDSLAGERGKEGGVVMALVKVHHVNAQEIATVLEPFVSPGGDVIAYPRSNLLIITELAAHARRLTELVETFDTDAFGDLSARIYRVENGSLEEIADELWAVLESYQVSSSGAGLYIIPLARLNSLAVIAFDHSVFVNVEHWLGILDVPSDGGAVRQVRVYQVENTKAVDLADILNEIFGDEGGEGGRRRARSGELAESGVGLGGGLASRAGRGADAGRGAGARGAAQRGGRTAGGAAQQAGRVGTVAGRRGGRATGLGRPGALFEQEVRIVADEVTNSLVIVATPRDYETIETVLRDLDVVPRQVLVEVLIAEISLSDDLNFGITQELIASGSSSNTDSTSSTSGDPGGTFMDLFGEAVRLTGGAPDPVTGGLVGVFTKFRNGAEVYRGILTALAKQNRVKVLSRPHVMTADNQEASILVGSEVPIITSQADTNVTTSGSTNFRQEVQYRDTGIIVRVTPQVNSQGLVNMKVTQEVSKIASPTTGNISSPTFTTRESDTTVVVQSGETIVISGIIDETHTSANSGVPFLKDLPVLGQLFGSDSDRVERTELIILITPYVVRDREEARSVTEEFKSRVDSVLEDVEIGFELEEANHTLILERPLERR